MSSDSPSGHTIRGSGFHSPNPSLAPTPGTTTPSVCAPHLRFRHPALPHLPPRHFIHYLYNGLARTSIEGTQYSTNLMSVIITTAAFLSTPGMPVTGLRSLHSTRNIAHSQIRLHQTRRIISTVHSLPVLSFLTLSSVSHILYGLPTILKMRA
jgi:hypothetical protein